MGQRSFPKGTEPWQTFHVRVCAVRGRREVMATVDTTFVTGQVGSEGSVPDVHWCGVVGNRDPQVPYTVDQAAQAAMYAIEEAFPTLF